MEIAPIWRRSLALFLLKKTEEKRAASFLLQKTGERKNGGKREKKPLE